jgi:26S proteasome regulatory subunit N12
MAVSKGKEEYGGMDGFERNVSQLLPLYVASSSSAAATTAAAAASPNNAKVLGLYLMYLLTQNRLAAFHATLETYVTSDDLAAERCIAFALTVERGIMVGSYDQVMASTKLANLPDALFDTFCDELRRSVRESIGDATEVAYDVLSVKDAAAMLMYDTEQEFMEYVAEERKDWMVEGASIRFVNGKENSVGAADIPSMKLIEQTLSYATELERIV